MDPYTVWRLLAILCLAESIGGTDLTCSTEGAVRLQDGINNRTNLGRVEICKANTNADGKIVTEWGTVCDDNWDYRDGQVVCRQLGYPTKYAAIARANNDFGSGSFRLKQLDEVGCTGTENRLLECPSIRDAEDNDCSHLEDAGVVCQDSMCLDGEVRLVAGGIWKEGRVEVCRNNTWRAVCNENFDSAAAKVVCHQLGLSSDYAQIIYYGQSTARELQQRASNCSGDEEMLDECLVDYNTTSLTCTHAGVQCNPPCTSAGLTECGLISGKPLGEHPTELCFCTDCAQHGDCCRDILNLDGCDFTDMDGCTEDDVRLMNGSNETVGRVEVCKRGTWGSVCKKYFEVIDAKIVCRQLGLQEEGAIVLPPGSFPGRPKFPWYSGVECEGHETKLVQCQNFGPLHYARTCDGPDIGVRCGQPPECEEGGVRLVGGETPRLGRLEMCVDGVWSAVCNDGWTEHDQNNAVVCRELGFNTSHPFTLTIEDFTTEGYTGSLFGYVATPFALGSVICSGEEPGLRNCSYTSLDSLGCTRGKEVALSCIDHGLHQQCTQDQLLSQDFQSDNTLLIREQFGICEPYTYTYTHNTSGGFCNSIFKSSGISHVYIPRQRKMSQSELQTVLNNSLGEKLGEESERCRDIITRYLCHTVLLPCGSENNTYVPHAICPEVCNLVRDECNWNLVQELEDISGNDFKNCETVGEVLEPSDYCCFDAGIVKQVTNTGAAVVAGGVIGSLLALFIFVMVCALPLIYYYVNTKKKIQRLRSELTLTGQTSTSSLPCARGNTYRHRGSITRSSLSNGVCMPDDQLDLEMEQIFSGGASKYVSGSNMNRLLSLAPPSPITSNYLRRLSSTMLIPSTQLRLLDSVGQGEFGIVYKAHLLKPPTQAMKSNVEPLDVAVKTLKGYSDQMAIREVLEESVKMKDFKHANVLNLIGVCIDAGPAPYIIMPFMHNGSLLHYLRKERSHLLLTNFGTDPDQIIETQKRLLNISLQIAQGMEYLAEKKFVHRDLAARNCMIDAHFVIKVSDFGLSEDVYQKNYFRQASDASVKLPIKWMAPESVNDGIFSERSDVWSFGITCWEVFSGGKTPYPGTDPASVVKMLETGTRLDKPFNAACCDLTYKMMLSCWRQEAQTRPMFSDIVQELNDIINPLADYLDMSYITDLANTSTGNLTEESVDMRHTKHEFPSGEERIFSRTSFTSLLLQQGVTTEAGVSIILKPSTPEPCNFTSEL